MTTVTPLTGSFASVDLDAILDTNANLLNSVGSGSAVEFVDNDGTLTADEPIFASIDGADRVPVDYVGSGTFSTADATIGLPPLLGVTIQINPVDVGFFSTTVDGVTQNYLVSGEPLNTANLTASVSGTLGGIPFNLVNADLTTIATTLGVPLNDITNQLVFGLDITEGAPFAVEDFVTCFARGTLIRTNNGETKVEDLKIGDLVFTADNGYQPIRWIGSQKVGGHVLARNENLRPIRIKSGALGKGLPESDLIVSPQHRILVRSNLAQKLFGTNEVLAAAKQFVQLDGIDIAHDLADVEYTHFMFDQHEVVIANGAETESLFTGPMALKSVGHAARNEILTLFPQLAENEYDPQGVRELISGRMARKLARRHIQNRKPLVASTQ